MSADDPGPTRRGFLQAAALVGVAGLAGCGAIPESPGSTATPRDSTSSSGGRGAYATWLHEPGAVVDRRTHYYADFFDATAFRDHASALPEGATGKMQSRVDLGIFSGLDVRVEDVEQYLVIGTPPRNVTPVFIGTFDAGAVIDGLVAEGAQTRGEYGGFTLLTRREAPVAVSEDAVLWHNTTLAETDVPASEAVDRIEAVIDAKRGEAPRYADANEEFALLADTLGSGARVTTRTFPRIEDPPAMNFEDEVASGERVAIGADTSRKELVKVFAAPEDVPVDALREWSDGNVVFDGYRDLRVSKSGRVGIVTGAIDTGRLLCRHDCDPSG